MFRENIRKIKFLIGYVNTQNHEDILKILEEAVLKDYILNWMKETLREDFEQDRHLFVNGDVQATRLAEEWIWYDKYPSDDDREAILDDEAHPVWDAAAEAEEWWQWL